MASASIAIPVARSMIVDRRSSLFIGYLSYEVDTILDFVSQIDLLSAISVAITAIAAISAVSSAVVAYMVYRKQTSPDVIAYLDADLDSLLLFFIIQNIGNGVAYDVEINLSRELPVDDSVKPYIDKGPIGNGIPILVPGGKRELYLCSTPDAVAKFGDDEITAKLRYYKSRKGIRRSIVAQFPLDVCSFHGVHVVSREKKTLDALNKISKSLNLSLAAQRRIAIALEDSEDVPEKIN